MKNKKKTAKRLFLFTIGLSVYLNIGWAIGTYHYDNVISAKTITASSAKYLVGPREFFKDHLSSSDRTFNQVRLSIAWPVFLLVVNIFWLAWIAFWAVWNSIVFLLWLVFAGGVAKLLGAG